MSNEVPAPAIERRFLGIAEVDSGTLLIGDPAYVLPRASDGKPGVDYEEVVRADGSIHAQPLAGRPVVLLQNFGGDGAFPVFGDFDDGALIGVRINLDPPMDDEDDEDEGGRGGVIRPVAVAVSDIERATA